MKLRIVKPPGSFAQWIGILLAQPGGGAALNWASALATTATSTLNRWDAEKILNPVNFVIIIVPGEWICHEQYGIKPR